MALLSLRKIMATFHIGDSSHSSYKWNPPAAISVHQKITVQLIFQRPTLATSPTFTYSVEGSKA